MSVQAPEMVTKNKSLSKVSRTTIPERWLLLTTDTKPMTRQAFKGRGEERDTRTVVVVGRRQSERMFGWEH